MSELMIPFPELAWFCLQDVGSTAVLMWLAGGVVGLTDRVADVCLRAILGVCAAVSVDALVLGWGGWSSRWLALSIAAALAAVLALARRRRAFSAARQAGASSSVAYCTGWAVVGVVLAGLGYGQWRGVDESAGYFARLGFGALVFVGAFLLLGRPALIGRRRGMSLVVLAGVIVVVSARTALWGAAWSKAAGGLTGDGIWAEPGMEFPRLHALLLVRRGVAKAESHRPGAVREFRGAGRIMHEEWWRRRLPDWTTRPVDHLLALSFGDSVSLRKGEKAVAMLLDDETGRFLVLTERGRSLSTTSGGPIAPIIATRPADMVLDGDSELLMLEESGGLLVVPADAGPPIRRALPPPETYRAMAAGGGSVFCLRADGSVVRFREGGTEEFLPPIWPGRESAVDLAVTPDGEGIYVLDAHGGIHPRGETPIGYGDLAGHDRTVHYWPSREMAAALAVTADGYPVYLDLFGGLHAVQKGNGGIGHAGDERPRLDRPEAVDLVVAETYRAVYVLTARGSVKMIADEGWLIPREREGER